MIIRPHGTFDRLMDASTLSRFLQWPRATIIKHCLPIACDVGTRRQLFSARQANTALAGVKRRSKTDAA